MNRQKAKKLLLLAALFTLLLLPAQPANAASKKSQALKAYRKFLAQSTTTWGDSSLTVSLKKCKFALAYIDSDSVPELILYCDSNNNSHAAGYYLLYTYKDGKVTYVDNLMDGFFYYRKKGVYASIYSGTGGYGTYYFKYSSGKSVYKFFSQDETKAGLDFNGDGKVKIYYEKVTKAKTPLYYSTTKSISASRFQKQLKKLVGSTKKSTAKFYANTASKRKKYLK